MSDTAACFKCEALIATYKTTKVYRLGFNICGNCTKKYDAMLEFIKDIHLNEWTGIGKGVREPLLELSDSARELLKEIGE